MKDDEIIRFIRESERPFVTATEVADEGDMSRQNAYRRLQRMTDEGRIEKYKAGSAAVIWWVDD
jgi:DNA-binding IclR family transcriptional regulator